MKKVLISICSVLNAIPFPLLLLILSAFLVFYFLLYLLQQTRKALDYINFVGKKLHRSRKKWREIKKQKNQFISTSNCQFLDILNYSKEKKWSERNKKKEEKNKSHKTFSSFFLCFSSVQVLYFIFFIVHSHL